MQFQAMLESLYYVNRSPQLCTSYFAGVGLTRIQYMYLQYPKILLDLGPNW